MHRLSACCGATAHRAGRCAVREMCREHHDPLGNQLVSSLKTANLQVDCTREVEMCREHQIMGFPSVRVYRKGNDDVVVCVLNLGQGQGSVFQMHL